MLVAAVARRFDELRREPAVPGCHRKQLASGPCFRRAAFVDLDVRTPGANDRVVRIDERLEREHVGTSAIEDGKCLSAGAEVLPKRALQGPRPPVVPVARRVAGVGGRDGCKDFRVDSRVVVARNAAPWSHGGTL